MAVQPSAEILNPPPMYRVRPYFEIKKVKLPDCMYMMKPVHQLPALSTGSQQSMHSALSYLETRQNWVLAQIGQLQERVKGIGQKLGVGPAEVGVIQQATSGGVVQDVVISCPPSAPPYVLLTLYKYISERVLCSCRVHVHSTALHDTSRELREFFTSLESHSKPRLTITLVWRTDTTCRGPTMIVSPHNQTPVGGVANIARYLSREYLPDLYESHGGPEQASLIDNWLDSVTGTLVNGNSKEKASVMRSLNSHLGSSPFLSGDRVSLADIVAYAVLCDSPGVKVTGNVKEWLKRCQKHSQFFGIPCSCLNET